MVRFRAPHLFPSQDVTLNVGSGKDSQVFYATISRLRASSGFFDTLFSNDWKEAHGKVVDLPEDQVDTFQLWLHAVYYSPFLVAVPNALLRHSRDSTEQIHQLN